MSSIGLAHQDNKREPLDRQLKHDYDHKIGPRDDGERNTFQ